jgi:hypothetical protein
MLSIYVSSSEFKYFTWLRTYKNFEFVHRPTGKGACVCVAKYHGDGRIL